MTVQVFQGDCIQVMKSLKDNSVDAVVTDPPYGLEFMGKEWDGGDGFRRSLNANDAGRDNVFGRTSRTSPEYRTSFIFQQWCEIWAAECLRILKPGGYLLAFGGTRTYHRLACGVEDAGFEIRDSLHWIYGSGFPKSLDVSKAIDKTAGVPVSDMERRALAAHITQCRQATGVSRAEMASWFTHAEVTKNWERTDAGHRVPSLADWLVLVERIGVSRDYRVLVEREDKRVRLSGRGVDRRGDGTVIGLGHSGIAYGDDPATDAAARWEGWGTALKPAHEPIVLARKPLTGTVAANVLEWGTGGLNIDGCRTHSAGSEGKVYTIKRMAPGATRNKTGANFRPDNEESLPWEYGTEFEGRTKDGRWPPNILLDEEMAAVLDAQSGHSISRIGKPRLSAEPGDGWGMVYTGSEYDDNGGASRFFPCFKYQAKASKKERPKGDVNHPTVKPVALMQWLVRLITPPGGIVLDPFAGSGTTGEACLEEGFNCILIEREPDYIKLIRTRLDSREPTLWD